MTQRNKPVRDKQVVIRGPIHRKLRELCFNHDLKIHELANALLGAMLGDQIRVNEIIEGLESEGTE